jgi:hypothetical protein
MKDINKIALINIYITNRVLRKKYEKGMAEDLLCIEAMFEKNDFSGLDDIFNKYFSARKNNNNSRPKSS